MLPKSEEFKLAMSAVRARIAAAKRRGTHSGMIDYSGCIYICDELVRIVNETDSLISDGKYRLAISIDLLVLTNCAKLASTGDSSSGCLNDAVYYTNGAIAKICSSVLPGREAAQFIYLSSLKESRNKAYDGWSEFVYDLLKCTATLATAENVGKLYTLLDEMRDEQSEHPYSTYYDLDCQVRYEAIKVTEGTETATAFVNDHLQYDGIRRIAIDNAVSGKEYDTAEKLCRERIAAFESNDYHWSCEWYRRLYDVFAAAEDTEKQIGLARELLLDKGDFEYYSVLKALLTTQKCWEKEYPQLIVELADCIPIERYMAILSEENEKALLLEQISKKPLCVFTYAKKLAKQYPSEVFSLCTDAIHSRAETANTRVMYRQVCSDIKKLASYGGRDEARAIIQELREKNPRRPAFLEELQYISAKL